MSVVTIIPLACCECVRRTFPINLIFLGLLTLSEAVVVGVLGALYGPETVCHDFCVSIRKFLKVHFSIRL